MKVTRSEFMLQWQLQAQTAAREVLQHVLHSLCFHQWAEALAIIFDSWTPVSSLTAEAIALHSTYPLISPDLNLKELEEYSYDDSAFLQAYVDVGLYIFLCNFSLLNYLAFCRYARSQRERNGRRTDESTTVHANVARARTK